MTAPTIITNCLLFFSLPYFVEKSMKEEIMKLMRIIKDIKGTFSDRNEYYGTRKGYNSGYKKHVRSTKDTIKSETYRCCSLVSHVSSEAAMRLIHHLLQYRCDYTSVVAHPHFVDHHPFFPILQYSSLMTYYLFNF